MFNGRRVISTMEATKESISCCYDFIKSALSSKFAPDFIYIYVYESSGLTYSDIPKNLIDVTRKVPRVKLLFGNKKFINGSDIVIGLSDYANITQEILTSKLNTTSEYDVILSLTSFPTRFKNVELITKCLDSLVTQNTEYKFHIVMTLFKSDISCLPNDIIDYCYRNNIEILPCEEDLKGNKKFFYVMQKYQNIPIIVVDDDLIFFDNLVQSLMCKYKQESNVIWTGWCQVMNLSNGILIYDPKLKNNVTSEVPSFKYKFGSGSGTLIPPGIVSNFNSVLDLIHQGDNVFHDELILKKLSLDNKIKVGLCKNTKYKCTVGGWLTPTQFIQNEIQPLVESKGNLHTVNCSKININGTVIYRGMNTEKNLLGQYIITDDDVHINE